MNEHRIVLYNPYWSTLGGGEKYVAVLASVLANLPNVQVKLLSTSGSISKAHLEKFYSIALDKVDFEEVPGGAKSVSVSSRDADVFAYLSNFRRVDSKARKTVLLFQIPYAKITIAGIAKRLLQGELSEALKDLYRSALLRSARSGDLVVITYSRFVHDVLEQNFGVRSLVLYPPIEDFAIEGVAKRNIILSVGRFFTGLYNEKRYDILTSVFRALCDGGLPGWEYHIIGSMHDDEDSKLLLARLQDENSRYPVIFHTNAPFGTLRDLYNKADIFWHGAGYGVDENRSPHRLEHFGMTTVEAMTAGCIPLVINKGGQKEVVRHGVDGFLWNTPEELAHRTLSVIERNVDAPAMQRNARARALDFSHEQFERRAREIFLPLLHQA